MDLDLATIGAVRAKALQVGFLVLSEAIADDVLALVGDLPERVQVVTLTDYSGMQVPAPAPADDAAARAELAALKAEAQRRGLMQ
jgi:hypothetical protein